MGYIVVDLQDRVKLGVCAVTAVACVAALLWMWGMDV